ncbi:YEY2 [Candida margitis]|uniref:YEY2 n=1 Tax=Candida margitis TaxID=1775924 RepID=UPI0022273C46|nr:YEY2 [Candida margitis]KAI5968553.1 YEY2 [Candida margitis]
MTMINFLKGHPTRTIIPVKEIANAYSKVLLDSDYLSYDSDPNNQHPLAYGTDPGNLDVRTTISNWVNDKYQIQSTSADLINLTAGASYGVANILASTTTPQLTKKAFVVTPTYFLINSVFVDAGLGDDLIAINETSSSEYDIDLEKLESELQKFGKTGVDTILKDPRGERKIYQFVMYLVPTFSNPGGMTYSLKTREKLLQLARKYDMLLISDDVYEFLNYASTTTIPPPISKINQIDQKTVSNKYGNSISNATFSKIIAPGLRVGWQESATPALVHQLSVTGANKSGGTPSQLSTLVVANLIESGKLDTIILNFKSVYAERAQVLKKSIKKYLPANTQVDGGDGGYFLWIKLPKEIDNHAVIEQLAQKGVVIPSGEGFEVLGSNNKQRWGDHCVRLSISYLTTEEIEQGVKIWGETIVELGNK